MKFRFCGEQDAPDWILGEVSVLSKMSSVRMKLICRQIINQLLGIGINYDKLSKLTHSSRIHFEPDELKAMVAALHFIFLNSAKYDVDSQSVLPNELQQLGLPKDICTAIVRAFQQAREPLREKLANNVLSLPRLTSLDWRVDYLLSSSYLQQADTNNIRFRLHVQPPNATAAAAQTPAAAEGETDQPQPEEEEAQRAVRAALTGIPPELLSFSLTPTDFKLLYADLKQAKQLFANV